MECLLGVFLPSRAAMRMVNTKRNAQKLGAGFKIVFGKFRYKVFRKTKFVGIQNVEIYA